MCFCNQGFWSRIGSHGTGGEQRILGYDLGTVLKDSMRNATEESMHPFPLAISKCIRTDPAKGT